MANNYVGGAYAQVDTARVIPSVVDQQVSRSSTTATVLFTLILNIEGAPVTLDQIKNLPFTLTKYSKANANAPLLAASATPSLGSTGNWSDGFYNASCSVIKSDLTTVTLEKGGDTGLTITYSSGQLVMDFNGGDYGDYSCLMFTARFKVTFSLSSGELLHGVYISFATDDATTASSN
jgi:hypothetical protein